MIIGGAPRIALIADITLVVLAVLVLAGKANAQPVAVHKETLPQDAKFCPSWAEAHERTLAILNNGRPPYAVRWKGCLSLKKGAQVDVVGGGDSSTEILYLGKHWFADEALF